MPLVCQGFSRLLVLAVYQFQVQVILVGVGRVGPMLEMMYLWRYVGSLQRLLDHGWRHVGCVDDANLVGAPQHHTESDSPWHVSRMPPSALEVLPPGRGSLVEERHQDFHLACPDDIPNLV